MFSVHLHVLRAHGVVLRKKNDFYGGYVKIIIFYTKISLFMTLFFVFYTAHKKCQFFMKLCVST
jgi:hypothetical protein